MPQRNIVGAGVLEFANLAAFPATGAAQRIYLALDTGKQYRWNGTAYVQLASVARVGRLYLASRFS